jgi:hypothetical protein
MLTPQPHQYRTRKRLLWPWIVGAVALLVIGGTFAVAMWITADDDGPGGGSADSLGLFNLEPPLRQAFKTCESGTLSDGDKTLVIDTLGEEYGTGSATFDGLMCTLNELKTPQAVIARMGQTRALDGMQSAHWDSFDASWTYHPDDGLDVILTEVS